ncbi:MAG: PH domain-containing protein [Actinomycetes bacterium]
MGYPKKLLADDEKIVYELRPHWRSLIVPVLMFLVAIFVGVFLIARFDNSVVRWVISAAMLVVVLGWAVKPFLDWYTTQYVFTDRRIIVRAGWISRQGRDMPLSRVNDVSFAHSPIERMLNSGTLIVESGGTNGQLVIKNVPDVEQIQADISRMHNDDDERRRRESSGGFNDGPSAGRHSNPDDRAPDSG